MNHKFQVIQSCNGIRLCCMVNKDTCKYDYCKLEVLGISTRRLHPQNTLVDKIMFVSSAKSTQRHHSLASHQDLNCLEHQYCFQFTKHVSQCYSLLSSPLLASEVSRSSRSVFSQSFTPKLRVSQPSFLCQLEQPSKVPHVPLTAFLRGTDDSISGDAVRNHHCPRHPLQQSHDPLPPAWWFQHVSTFSPPLKKYISQSVGMMKSPRYTKKTSSKPPASH